jgi:hypothetical protein
MLVIFMGMDLDDKGSHWARSAVWQELNARAAHHGEAKPLENPSEYRNRCTFEREVLIVLGNKSKRF